MEKKIKILFFENNTLFILNFTRLVRKKYKKKRTIRKKVIFVSLIDTMNINMAIVTINLFDEIILFSNKKNATTKREIMKKDNK